MKVNLKSTYRRFFIKEAFRFGPRGYSRLTPFCDFFGIVKAYNFAHSIQETKKKQASGKKWVVTTAEIKKESTRTDCWRAKRRFLVSAAYYERGSPYTYRRQFWVEY